jgi:tRNA A37 methylthiotransferase MiaB
LPHATVVIGGTYATLLSEHARAIAPGAHVVSGPADALADLLPRIGFPELTGELPQAPSVTLRSSSSRLSSAGVVRLNEGCPRRCRYCGSSLLSPRFVGGEWRCAAHQIESLVSAGIRDIAFYDDALLAHAQDAAMPLLEWVIEQYGERSLAFFLPNAIHTDLVTGTVADRLFRAGVRDVRLGAESADSVFHTEYDRKGGPDRIAAAVEFLRSAGFRTDQIGAYLLAGLPGQPAESVFDSIEWLSVRQVAPHIAEYSPVPGTPLFADACSLSRYPLSDEPLCHNNSIFPTASAEFTRADLVTVKQAAREVRRQILIDSE